MLRLDGRSALSKSLVMDLDRIDGFDELLLLLACEHISWRVSGQEGGDQGASESSLNQTQCYHS